jgi:hypothetical protein
MDLPDFVPELLELAPNGGRACCLFDGNRANLVPREEATTSFVRSLNSLVATEALVLLSFANVYFEIASISALQHNLDRLLDQGCNFNIIEFCNCKGEVGMATCVLLKSKCRSLEIIRQRLTFTPALAEALRKSASLAFLTFKQVTFDKAEMERLALCLCENASIKYLTLNGAFQEDESMVAFVKYLPEMCHLRSLTLEGNEFGEKGKRALFEVLEKEDHCLDELRLEGQPTSLQNYVHFLLWLKKNGGNKAISRSSRMKWIELLVRFNNDEAPPSALYFILCSDPGRFENL